MHGGSVLISGKLFPLIAGQKVQLQKFTAGKWQNIGKESVTDSNGEFTLSTIETKRGVITVRVLGLVGSESILSSERSIVVR